MVFCCSSSHALSFPVRRTRLSWMHLIRTRIRVPRPFGLTLCCFWIPWICRYRHPSLPNMAAPRVPPAPKVYSTSIVRNCSSKRKLFPSVKPMSMKTALILRFGICRILYSKERSLRRLWTRGPLAFFQPSALTWPMSLIASPESSISPWALSRRQAVKMSFYFGLHNTGTVAIRYSCLL